MISHKEEKSNCTNSLLRETLNGFYVVLTWWCDSSFCQLRGCPMSFIFTVRRYTRTTLSTGLKSATGSESLSVQSNPRKFFLLYVSVQKLSWESKNTSCFLIPHFLCSVIRPAIYKQTPKFSCGVTCGIWFGKVAGVTWPARDSVGCES